MSVVPTLLSVDGLSKSYGGVHAVRSVSFELRAGEILALIGPNGAGKSTCFDMLNGQKAPDSGRITVLGGFIVLIVVAFPKGIVGILETIRHRRQSSSPKPAVLGIESAE